MDILKKALIKGLPTGLLSALIVICARMLITKTGFSENVGSVYGILTIICFPLAFILYYYSEYKKKQ